MLYLTLSRDHERVDDQYVLVPVGSTIDFLQEVCDGEVMNIRKRFCVDNGEKWDNYTGPKDIETFQVSFQFFCFQKLSDTMVF